MKIIFSGGGTLGPVTPLLAIYEIVKEKYPDASFVWIGTKDGPEKDLIMKVNIPFFVLSSGKFRRYASIWNITDIFKTISAFFKALKKIKRERPDLCISAGGFVSVPVHIAAWFCRVPTWIHQQDADIGLSNKIMAPFAKVITVALNKNLINFSSKKTNWIGNPVRRDILRGDKNEAIKIFNLKSNLPILLVTGGGTGSETLNQFAAEAAQHLVGVCEIIHLSGKERENEKAEKMAGQFENYHSFRFLTDEMKHAYAAADLVVSRGGFGTLTELAALGKAAIIVPLPGHQEDNVKVLAEQGAVILFDQRIGSGVKLAGLVKELLTDTTRKEKMKNKLQELLPRAKDESILNIIKFVVK